MASGEARATWQRMAKCRFFQDDAARNPKLTCSSLSGPQYDTNDVAINRTGQTASNYVPITGSQGISDLPSDMKWWIQNEMNSTYLKDSSHEQPDAVGEKIEGRTLENLDHLSEHNSDFLPRSDYDFNIDGSINSFVQRPWMLSSSYMRKDGKTRVEELKSMVSGFQQPLKCKDLDEYWHEDEIMDWNAIEKLVSRKLVEDYFELKPQCKGEKKVEPWWHIADKDELALLIAQGSECQVENCDLPQPQSLSAGTDSFMSVKKFNQNMPSSVNFEHNRQSGICKQADFVLKTSSTDGRSLALDKVDSSNNLKCPLETKDASKVDNNKAQLLQALCHSQTRARKAEIAAQKAQNEKEHIVKLLFKQASHLFAYKQWLQLLQLESLCLQMKIGEHQISTLLPDLPWMSLKWPVVGSVNRDEVARKGNKKKCTACRYIFAFAIGFTLASAGLLLGMTLSWLPLVL